MSGRRKRQIPESEALDPIIGINAGFRNNGVYCQAENNVVHCQAKENNGVYCQAEENNGVYCQAEKMANS